jgi:hypothetical protein
MHGEYKVKNLGIVCCVDSSCMVEIGIVGIKVTRLWFNPGTYEALEEMEFSQFLQCGSGPL